MKDFLIKRLTETSTWAGLFLVASAWGLNFTEQQQAALPPFSKYAKCHPLRFCLLCVIHLQGPLPPVVDYSTFTAVIFSRSFRPICAILIIS